MRSSDTVQLRVARHTGQLDAIVAFYRDRLGLPVRGRFVDHDGYDGVFLDLPGTGAHLEFTSGGPHGAPDPHPESLIVLYLDDRRRYERLIDELADVAVRPANPYWQRTAHAVVDPDGHQVILVLGQASPDA
jgi:catechol 2,3-dioxygenase-like lactoylglutathione lyase family enzyme